MTNWNGNGHSGITVGKIGFYLAVYVACPLAVMSIGSLSSLTLKHHEEITTLQIKEEVHAKEVADLKSQVNRMEAKLDRLLERK